MTERERAALEAVARRFSATWDEGDDRHDAYLTVARKRIAIDIATLKRRQGDAARLRLRFDKVVIRLMGRLQATLGETVPDGTTVLLTVTAPIRLPAKTAAALEDRMQALLRQGSPGRDEDDTIHGNRVRIRLESDASARTLGAPKLIGFVHNPDADPRLLLDLTTEWLGLIRAEAGRPAAERAGGRWLVVIGGVASYVEVYRHIGSQLRTATGLTKILMVLDDGRIEVLTE